MLKSPIFPRFLLIKPSSVLKMGKSLSKLLQVEQQLQTVSFRDIHDGILLSTVLQSFVYYLCLGVYIQNCFDGYTKAGISEENIDVKYAKSAISRAFSGYNANFLLGVAHQIATARLISDQLKNHRQLLPVILLAGTSSLLYTCIAWFHPVKLLVSAEVAAQGRSFADFSLQHLFETLSDRQRRFLTVCHISGAGLMLSALLHTRANSVLVAGYLLFAGVRSYQWLNTKSLI